MENIYPILVSAKEAKKERTLNFPESKIVLVVQPKGVQEWQRSVTAVTTVSHDSLFI
jgi:hypothetical protein